MEEIQKSATQMKLIQKSNTYKLIIPAEVENKIRFTCQKVWNVEWSGALFYTYTGSFETNDLEIICKDIYIMDIGNQTYTEFDMNPDVISYMCENPELLNCQIGLIHSHNTFATFFSGTDTDTLRKEGQNRNNFVSLIVNNEGTYTAAITRRVKSKKVRKDIEYNFFDKGVMKDSIEYSSQEDEIEWFYLDIDKQEVINNFASISDRLEEIRKIKNAKSKTQIDTSNISTKNKNIPKFNTNNYVGYNDLTLFKDSPVKWESELPYGEVSGNKTIIKQLILQLITSSIIIPNDSKIDINKWVNSMPIMYQKRFGKGEEGMKIFEEWADMYAEFILLNIKDINLMDLGMDDFDVTAIYAYDIIVELEKLPKNDYIQGYIKALEKYL